MSKYPHITIRESRDEDTLRFDCMRGQETVGGLTLRLLEPGLWQAQKPRLDEATPDDFRELTEALRIFGTTEQPQILSNNLNQEVNGLLEQSGWQVGRRKAFVERSLQTPLPQPTSPVELSSLAEVGETEFVRVLLAASQGDPFETSTAESAQQDFQDLIEYAGSAYDPSDWFVATLGGQATGVVLPQVYPDEPGTGTLFYMGVCPAFRGKGLGRNLHATGLQQLQGRGARTYQGSTDLRNTGMRRIFEQNGCTEVRQQWFYEWQGR